MSINFVLINVFFKASAYSLDVLHQFTDKTF